ncbi:MAG TPA: hypothetical protein VNO30_01625 [Kofleriaceae bacterium]|nr:hypothetical protein [Kofleriaceae bacterium]
MLLWLELDDRDFSAFRAAPARGSWLNAWPSSTSKMYLELVSRPAPLMKLAGGRPSSGVFTEEHAVQTASKQAMRSKGPPLLFEQWRTLQQPGRNLWRLAVHGACCGTDACELTAGELRCADLRRLRKSAQYNGTGGDAEDRDQVESPRARGR